MDEYEQHAMEARYYLGLAAKVRKEIEQLEVKRDWLMKLARDARNRAMEGVY